MAREIALAKSYPKNRTSEVLFTFIQKDWTNYYELSKELRNLNVHRVRDILEEKYGINFESRYKNFKNKFGRMTRMKEFKMTTTKTKATAIYNKINK